MSEYPAYAVEYFDEFLPPEPEAEASGKIDTVVRRRPNRSSPPIRSEVLKRARAYMDTVEPAVQGEHGDQHTFTKVCRIVRGFDLSDDEALDVLDPWNQRCQPPWTERDLLAKAQGARRYGTEPIGGLLDVGSDRISQRREISIVEPTEPTGTERDDSQDDNDRPEGYSEDALTDRFSRTYGNDLKFIPSWGWMGWDSTRWKRIPDVIVMERARQVCRLIAEQCKDDPDVKRAPSLARSIASAKTVAAVVRLACGDSRHFVNVEEWDVDPWLFNTPGGTIDLKTGRLRRHQREDRITKIANATPQGDCPKWLAFLDRVTGGNVELQAYLQRLAGYALVGDPMEECLDFCYGPGGNGKGTFLSSLQYMFGEYATTAGTETFVESKGDKHPCDLAKLAGARLVISNEIDQGQRWDEARIKNLTGRDTITARFMRKDFFDFIPQFTLIISGNHRPSLKTVDESIRRRFHLVPFDVTIPAEEQNTSLKDELRAEADGILRWALQGCLDWQQQRLNPPEIVLEATAEYLASEDVFEMWLSECCKRGDGFEELSGWAYESFRQWKLTRGEGVPGHKKFSEQLTELGYELKRTNKERKVFGLRLTNDERNLVEPIIEERKRQKR